MKTVTRPSLLKFITKLIWGKRYINLLDQKITGTYRHTASFSRELPLEEKYESIREEFAGSNELSFEIIRRIIQIRRNQEVKKNWLFIFGALLNHYPEILPNLTSRWIISILDTFSDMPCPLEYRLAAESVRNFLLGSRLGYSMALQHCVDPEISDEPLRFLKNIEIWDGIIHFNYQQGDTYRNLIIRSTNSLQYIPMMKLAWQVLLMRMNSHAPFHNAFMYEKHSRDIFSQNVNNLTP